MLPDEEIIRISEMARNLLVEACKRRIEMEAYLRYKAVKDAGVPIDIFSFYDPEVDCFVKFEKDNPKVVERFKQLFPLFELDVE